MVYFIKIIGLFIVLITTALSYGQRDYGRIPNLPKESLETKESDDSYRPFDFNLTVKNMTSMARVSCDRRSYDCR